LPFYAVKRVHTPDDQVTDSYRSPAISRQQSPTMRAIYEHPEKYRGITI